MYEQDIFPLESFRSIYYNCHKLGIGTTINNDDTPHPTDVTANPDVSFCNSTGRLGDKTYLLNYKDSPQHYFENNVMLPIIYKGSNVNFTAGDMRVEFDYEVVIEHKIRVRMSDRDGMPEKVATGYLVS